MTETIEYTYTTYKMPASEDVTTGGPELAQNIAEKVFPDETTRSGKLWKITKDNKNYICGFVTNTNEDGITPTREYFVTLEVGTDGKVHHVNCYKCTFGNLANTVFTGSRTGILKDGFSVFGFDGTNVFFIPPYSFFLEGAHEAFNDLPAGKYESTLLV